MNTILLQKPIVLTNSGSFEFDHINNRTNAGYYWESEAVSIINARFLYFSSTSMAPQNQRDKGQGLALRCLVR